MKRIEMNRRLPADWTGTRNLMVQELEGFMGLGMKDEVARLARECFTGRRVEAEYFDACLHAVLTTADDLAEWKPLVAEAFARLSQRGRRRVRFMMLCLYCSVGDFATAQRFLAKRFNGPTGLVDLGYALETHRALDRPDEARRLWPKAVAWLETAENSVGRAMLADGLAGSLLEACEWDAAIHLWEGLVDDECFAESANFGLVELHLTRARLAVETGLAAVEKLKHTPDPELEVMLPGNDRVRWERATKELRGLLPGLTKLLEQPARVGDEPRIGD
jgi:hypothetical protein